MEVTNRKFLDNGRTLIWVCIDGVNCEMLDLQEDVSDEEAVLKVQTMFDERERVKLEEGDNA